MKPLVIALSISLIPALTYSQPISFESASTQNETSINQNRYNPELTSLPPNYMPTGAMMISYDNKPTGDEIFAHYDETNKQLTGNLQLKLKGDLELITLLPQPQSKIEQILNSTKFFDKKGNQINFENTIQAMWTNDEGDVIVSQSTRYGIRLTAFKKDSSGSEIAICQAKYNTKHSPNQ